MVHDDHARCFALMLPYVLWARNKSPLAARTYVVFRLTLDGGPLHPRMQAAVPKIWRDLLPKSGLKAVQAPDLEVYPADFEPVREGAYVDMHVAIEAG